MAFSIFSDQAILTVTVLKGKGETTMSANTLVVEDFSALGQISILAALNVLQAFDIETAALPTTILSTQTEGFGQPARLETKNWLKKASEHWKSLTNVYLKGAIVGYLGSADLIKPISQLLMNVKSPILIDPVMADRGALYPGLASDYPLQMRHFCQLADVITPNWTELCLLTGHSKPLKADLSTFKQLLRKLQDQGIRARVVATGVHIEQAENALVYDGHYVKAVTTKRYPGHFYGAGDTFAALLLGNILTNPNGLDDLYRDVVDSCQQLSIAIQETSTYPDTDRRYGLKLRNLLQLITKN